MKHISVIQHTQSEWLGHIEDHLEARGVRFGYTRPFVNGGKVPAPATIGDGLILVGGGRWGAASPEFLLPTLEAEVRLARACLMLDKPVLGIGLGAQILSLAAEGSVEAAPLSLTVGQAASIGDNALAGFLPATFPSVVYMRDRPVPPVYAKILATDEDGRPALFQIGGNSFGFAGHPGLRRAMIEDLIMEFDEHPPGASSSLQLVGEVSDSIEDALVPIMTGIVRLTGWIA
jgi:GMP synthase-like glutamine amidotransferase